jgi:hypothetical protein
MQLTTSGPRLAAAALRHHRSRGRTFEEGILWLVDAHERAARLASDAGKLAKVADDCARCDRLTRRSDAHLKAAWALVFLGIAVLISCDAASES